MAQMLPAITTIRLRYIGLLLTATCFITGFRYLNSTLREPYGYVPDNTDRQAFRYLDEHVNDSDLIICERPRLITLYTNKRCMIQAWQHDMAFNKRVFDSMDAKYLVIMNKSDGGYYKVYLPQFAHPIDSTLIASGYMLYKLKWGY